MGWHGGLHTRTGARNMRQHREFKRDEAEARQAAERYRDKLRELQRVKTSEPKPAAPTKAAKRRARRARKRVDSE